MSDFQEHLDAISYCDQADGMALLFRCDVCGTMYCARHDDRFKTPPEYTYSTEAEAEGAAQELRDTDKAGYTFTAALMHHTDNEPQVWIIEIYSPPPARQYIGSL